MLLLLSTLVLAAAPSAPAAAGENTWKLDHIFGSVDAFEAARAETEKAIAQLPGCKGKLGTDAATLAKCLDAQYAVAQNLGKLQSYAGNHSSADTRDDAWQGREGAVYLLYTQYAEAMSWFEPEIMAVGADKIEGFLKAEPKLAPYAYPLRVTLRRAEHVLSPEEERILALSTAVTGVPGEAYEVFANAELPWPEITVAGEKVTLRQSEYGRLRVHPDPAVRKQVFDAFFGALAEYEGTMGVLLGSQVQAHWFTAQARGYGSSVEASLAGDFVPRAVYDTLVAETHANLPTLHRYLKLRADMLGIEKLTYADLYPPLVKSDRVFDLAESERLTLEAQKPLGKEYQARMREGFAGGWIDVYPREGKRSGAYMSDAAYGVHPYVLLNHNDDYDGASTLAHEFGHAIHSSLAMEAQPYPTADYSTFTAEIASTFNEALLLDHMLKNAKTDDERLFFLGSALENLRTTYFRQAMFGEFELQIHERVEKGEPVTGGILTEMYADLVREYYGHDQGFATVDDVWTHEWEFIPHFYYNFYVYQYATSLAASSLLSQSVLDKEKGSVERYLTLLKAGGSNDPYLLLKDAGVDLATPEPYRAVAARMNAIMDQIEAIRAKQKK